MVNIDGLSRLTAIGGAEDFDLAFGIHFQTPCLRMMSGGPQCGRHVTITA
jgi:hypothetical protein